MLPEAQAASWRAVGRPEKRRIDVDEEGAEVALHRVQLGGEVADVADLDVLRLDAGGLEAAQHRLAHHRDDVLVLLRPVAREVGLVSAENVDWGCHVAVSLRCGSGMPHPCAATLVPILRSAQDD